MARAKFYCVEWPGLSSATSGGPGPSSTAWNGQGQVLLRGEDQEEEKVRFYSVGRARAKFYCIAGPGPSSTAWGGPSCTARGGPRPSCSAWEEGQDQDLLGIPVSRIKTKIYSLGEGSKIKFKPPGMRQQ